ncbi:short-chain collagen C4-like [Anneissia japonica]|uniref:short-chain collagen C4-like n=1 Tax=Anneissia japonica TaxID=1529436 RepID=UPI00142583D8|nr:short-chain collagen C4-like [Anneissia japonica]
MKMMVFKGASIVVFSLCLLILNTAKGEEENKNGGNPVWNFLFGGKETHTYNSPLKPPMTTGESGNASTAYVRWGRDVCNPDTSETVYTGYVGGGSHAHKGGGTNPLCLPETPEYDDTLTVNGGSRSPIFGAEYETNTYSPFSYVHDSDTVCALCLARGRSTTSMIPAKRTCPPGWTKEYGGLLMGSHNGHYGHDFLCIDRNPQGRSGSSASKDGFLLYAVEGTCGSLPCPPYVSGKEISCVVCSR